MLFCRCLFLVNLFLCSFNDNDNTFNDKSYRRILTKVTLSFGNGQRNNSLDCSGYPETLSGSSIQYIYIFCFYLFFFYLHYIIPLITWFCLVWRGCNLSSLKSLMLQKPFSFTNLLIYIQQRWITNAFFSIYLRNRDTGNPLSLYSLHGTSTSYYVILMSVASL